MSPPFSVAQRSRVEAFQRRHRVGLVTLLFTDIVGSTQLKQELGSREAVMLIERHHALVRELLGQFHQAEEIETAGDSFFIVFAKPSEAVRFSLQLQARLRAWGKEAGRRVDDRIGIHVGEVFIEAEPASEKLKHLYGIHVDTCARVMSLAQGRQILMTRFAFDNAREILRGQDIEGLGALSWMNHGPYVLKGVEGALEIGEVGEVGESPLTPPSTSDKAHRQVSAGSEPVLGWRPAPEQSVPGTQWVLEQKLGEGGFGEVWVGRHQALKERRVFKFCFRADRVRALRREVTLFRLLKERIGEHPNIVKLYDVYFDEPPYYLVEEYIPGKDLVSWCKEHGGMEKMPLETRLEMVAQAAEALQAAHEAGVIHRDVKPSNILIRESRESARIENGLGENSRAFADKGIQVKLTDFGIGQVVSEEYLAGVTRAGFTETMIGSTSSATGTQMYMAPELLAGKPASTRSDIYSLGVVLYQLLVGDFSRPVTTDWVEQISDPLLRQDLKRCFAGDPQARFVGAGQLAVNLRALPERRAQLEREQADIAARERAAYRRGMIRTAGLAAVIVAITGGLALVALKQSQRAKTAAEAERRERTTAQRNLYVANMNLVQQAWEQNNVARVRELLEETAAYPERGFEWYYWQRQTHQELKTLRGHVAPVGAVAFSPDGQRIVTGSGDQTAKVWEAASGKELLTLKGHSAEVRSVAFSLDGQRIVTGSEDQTAKVWEAASGKELLTLKGHSAAVWSVAFSPDGQRIVTGSWDHTAKVWDIASGKELLTLKGHSDRIWSVAFSPDGQRIVTGSEDQTARVWEAASGKEVFTLKGHSSGIISVAFSPDGQRIVTGSDDGTAKVWEAASTKELLTLNGHSADIWSVAFSPDGRRIITGSWDQTAKVWDATRGKELLVLKGHNAQISAVASSPDGRRIVTGSWDRTAKVWEAASGEELLTLKGHSNWIESVAFSPDSLRIVTGSYDGTAKVWEAASGKEPLTLKGHSNWIWGVAFSPDGQRIVTGSADQTAKVWEASAGKELLTLKGHGDWVTSVAFSPDGQRIVTGSWDQTAKVWEAASGKELLTLKGHSAAVLDVGFSPDGQRIITGSEDRSAKVWEAASGKELLTLRGHGDWVTSVAFSPDGQRIVTGNNDGTAKVWEAASSQDVAAWLKDEQAVAGRTGSRQTWNLEVAAFLKSEQAAAQANERDRPLRAQDPGAIKQWLVFAPIAFEGGNGGAALEQEQILQEGQLRPRAGERVEVGGSERVWRTVQQEDYLIDFNQLLGSLTKWSVAYAVCYIESEGDQSGLILKVGSDDQAKVYLNGKEIYKHGVGQPYVRDQDVVAGLELKAGLNVLVFKVVNESGPWQGSIRFTDAAGHPVKGIQVTLTPP